MGASSVIIVDGGSGAGSTAGEVVADLESTATSGYVGQWNGQAVVNGIGNGMYIADPDGQDPNAYGSSYLSDDIAAVGLYENSGDYGFKLFSTVTLSYGSVSNIYTPSLSGIVDNIRFCSMGTGVGAVSYRILDTGVSKFCIRLFSYSGTTVTSLGTEYDVTSFTGVLSSVLSLIAGDNYGTIGVVVSETDSGLPSTKIYTFLVSALALTPDATVDIEGSSYCFSMKADTYGFGQTLIAYTTSAQALKTATVATSFSWSVSSVTDLSVTAKYVAGVKHFDTHESICAFVDQTTHYDAIYVKAVASTATTTVLTTTASNLLNNAFERLAVSVGTAYMVFAVRMSENITNIYYIDASTNTVYTSSTLSTSAAYAGSLVQCDASSSNAVLLTNANTIRLSKCVKIGVATATGVVISGIATLSGLTKGLVYYASESGELALSGDLAIGVALSSTQLLLY